MELVVLVEFKGVLSHDVIFVLNWTSTRENLTLLHANNKGADHPAHPHSLTCAFVSLDGLTYSMQTFRIFTSLFSYEYVAD